MQVPRSTILESAYFVLFVCICQNMYLSFNSSSTLKKRVASAAVYHVTFGCFLNPLSHDPDVSLCSGGDDKVLKASEVSLTTGVENLETRNYKR